MSVRAYKIKKIQYEEEPTFNLWHNTWILNNVASIGLDENGQGVLYIEKSAIEQAIEDIDIDKWNIEDETKEETIEILHNMLNDCDEYGVEYYCF